MKKALIIHGWGANPGMNWFPGEIAYLESLGYLVEAPLMPNKYNPHEKPWLQVIEDFAPDEETILIGHSLGGTTILEYLEKSEQKIRAAILVATPIRFTERLELASPHSFKLYAESVATECFLGLCEYEEIFDWDKIKKAANKISLIYKTGDLRVPPEEGKILASLLDAELQILEGNDHGNIIDIRTINLGIF